MGKNSYPKEEDILVSPRGAGSAGGPGLLPGVLKLVLGILLLPFVYSVTLAFYNQFIIQAPMIKIYFLSGMISFLVLHLLIWEPMVLYKTGQQMVEKMFRFFAPLVKIASFIFPIYTLILFAVYFLARLSSNGLANWIIFLIGFSIVFHFTFSARSIRSKPGPLKSNHLFGLSLVYIINMFLLSAGLGLTIPEFSFAKFATRSYLFASDIYTIVFTQLFL